MNKATPFSEMLDILVSSDEVFDSGLMYGLSGLSRNQINKLERVWSDIAPERRRNLIQHLNNVSEHNFELDFRSVNHMALEDTDSEVRRHAIEGLWEDESEQLMHKLVHMVQNDLSQDVRTAAISELGRFILLGEYEEIDASDARVVQDTVLHILHSNEDNDIRRRALESIANCGREGVHDAIREFYNHHEPSMRISAVFAMGRTCDSVWTDEIISELDSPSPEMQYEAARAAGTIQLAEAIPYLTRLLEETEDTEVLEIAIWALGEIGGEAVRKVLQQIIERAEAEDDAEILAAAEDALDMANLPGDDLWLFDFEP